MSPEFEPSPILAFGGNDRASRSARARLQWRDRYGKFIEMGRGIKFKVSLPNIRGPVSVVGKFVGSTNNPDYGQVYVSDHPSGLPNGFYNVKSSNAAETVANLSEADLAKSGISLGRNVNGNLVSSRGRKDVQTFDQLQYSAYPLGWKKRADGTIGTDDESFKVKDAGDANGYGLYHNSKFVGFYPKNAWDKILSKTDALDAAEERQESGQAPLPDADAPQVPAAPEKPVANLPDAKPTDSVLTPGIRRGRSKEGVELPVAQNRTNDTTKYAVERESDGKIGTGNRPAMLNRTEKDIYDARKELARRQKLVESAQAGVNRADGMTGANPQVIARRQAAADKNLNDQKASLAEAQAHLDKLEKGGGLKAPDQDTPNNNALVDATAPATPAEQPTIGPNDDDTPLVTNDDTSQANVSTPSALDTLPHQPVNGDSDDPKVIAQDFNKKDLQDAFTEAVASGDADVRLQTPDGTATTVPAEAVRDALQRQGHDTNTDVNPDPQITTQEALDALPAGSKVQRGTITLTKADDGSWRSPKGAQYANLMQTSSENNLKLILVDNAGDKNAPSVAQPIIKTDTAPAPDAGPTFKNARELVRGDEVANGTIINVYRTTRTPPGKVEAEYLDNRGNVRRSQWNAGTRIGIVKRPARALPGDKPADKAPTPTSTPTPETPKAPDAPAATANTPEAQAARIEALPNTDFTAEWQARQGNKPQVGKDGSLELVTKKKSILDGTPEETEPLKYIYRAISEEDYQSILKNGYIKSDGRMNLVSDEGTVATHRDPSFYLPNATGERGRVIRINYDPADKWRVDTDGYLKTDAEIPNSRISAVSGWSVGAGGSHFVLDDERLPGGLFRGLDNEISNQVTTLRNAARSGSDQAEEDRLTQLANDIYAIKTANRIPFDSEHDVALAQTEAYLKAMQERFDKEPAFNGDAAIRKELKDAATLLEQHKAAFASKTSDTQAPAVDTPMPATPIEPEAPAEVKPPVVSTDANQNAVVVPNADAAPAPTSLAQDTPKVTDKERAQHLARTRIAPSDDPFLSMALDDVNNNADPSALAIAYVNDKLKDAPKITPPAKQDTATSAPTPTPPATPNAPATPDAAPTPQPAAPAPQAPNGNNALAPVGTDINDPDLVLQAVKRAYPNHKELGNGDLVLGSREVTGPKGARKRYDLVVTRTGNEYFYTYVRETDLTSGAAKSQRFGPMVHSAKALDTRIQVGLAQINDRKVPTWFNSRARRPFVKTDDVNPATGEREHLKEQPVLDSTISDIHKSINDNQVSEDLVRNIYDVVSRLGVSNRTLGVIAAQHNLSSNKVNAIVDAINLHVNQQNAQKIYQTWVSGDGLTPLYEGDLVQHVDGRIGVVKRRIVQHDSKKYGYSDYIFFQEMDAAGNPVGNQRNMTSRKFSIIQTAQGTDGSERIGPNAVALAAPQLTTRGANKAAKQNAMRAARQNVTPPVAPVQAPVDCTNPAAPTVNVNGTDHNLNLNRHHTTQNDTPVTKPADQVAPGDLIQTTDGRKSTLSEVVSVTPGDGSTAITTVTPNDNNTDSVAVNTVNVPSGDGAAPNVAVLTPQPNTDGVANQADFDRLTAAYNAVDTNDPNSDDNLILDTLRALLTGPDSGLPKSDIDSMVGRLSTQPQRKETLAQIVQNAALQDTVNVAQAVSTDNPDATDLKIATDQAVLTADAVSTPSGRVQAIIDENSGVTDLTGYRYVSKNIGSTPGGFYENSQNNDRVYVKFQNTQARADNEVLASALYRAVGRDSATVIRGKLPRHSEPTTYSPLLQLDPTRSLNTSMRRKAFADAVHDGFAVDAWLANWDGTLNNNIGVDTNGNPVHLDLGGAIRFRARGQLKPDFAPDVKELDTLTNGRNSQQFKIYGRMTDSEKQRSARLLLNINDAEIDTLVKEITSTSMKPNESQALADTLKARRKFILDKYGVQDPNASAATPTAPTGPTPVTVIDAPAGSNPNPKNLPILQGYTVKKDRNGVAYFESGISREDNAKLKAGQVALPAYPFKMKNTSRGDTHFYDRDGIRRWGQYGAGGAMIRRQNADGSYSILMGKRGSTLSTDPNRWSVVTGAHVDEKDAANPVNTAWKELGEEIKIDKKALTHRDNTTFDLSPDWKFTYSMFDLDPAQQSKYEKVPIKDPREISEMRWVPVSDLGNMNSNNELHSSMSPQIITELQAMSARTPYVSGAPSAAPAAPAAVPDAPETSAVPDAPAAATPVAGAVPDGEKPTKAQLDNAPVGQVVTMVTTDGKTPRGATSFIRTEDGWRIQPNPGDTDIDTTKDQQKFIDGMADKIDAGTDNILSLVAGVPTYEHVAVPAGDPVDEVWEYSAPEGTLAHYIADNNSRYEFVKGADNTWSLTPDSTQSFEPNKDGDPSRVWSPARAGKLLAGPLPELEAGPHGEEVDEAWISKVKPGAQVTFRSPITGNFQSLSKVNQNLWSDGQNVYTSEAVNRLRGKNGGNKFFSGPIPDTSADPERGTAVDETWMDAASEGTVVNFRDSAAHSYIATKQADGTWKASAVGTKSRWDYIDGNSYTAGRIALLARSSVRQGQPLSSTEKALRSVAPTSASRESLAKNLATVDPYNHITAHAPLGFMSDAQINALNNEIGGLTNNFTSELPENQALALIEKYRPEVPQDIQGWLGIAEGLANEVAQLRALAGETDSHDGAKNLQFAHANYVLAAIATLRGFDKPPVQTNKPNSTFSRGMTRIYRGLKDFRGRTAADMIKQLREGDAYQGSGVYGNGTYVTTARGTSAGKYTNRYNNDGSGLTSMAINPSDMKILEFYKEDSQRYGSKDSMRNEFSRQFKSELQKFLEGRGLQEGTPKYKAAYDRIYRLLTERTERGNDRKYGGRIDIGVWAAMMGYDAIRVPQGRSAVFNRGSVGGNSKTDEVYYVILNRGKVFIGKE